MVFEYLVEKGLFRIGAELRCPTCRLTSWVGLDALTLAHVCELCGAGFEATRQLLMVIPGYGHHAKADVLLGECKDEGGAIDPADVDHLRQIADALPADRFETYIVFAKLAPFTAEEITLVRTLNGPYQRRVILLTAREIEPYHIYERAEQELGRAVYANSAEDLASVTAQMYFREPAEPG
jgi:hypothetical protein